MHCFTHHWLRQTDVCVRPKELCYYQLQHAFHDSTTKLQAQVALTKILQYIQSYIRSMHAAFISRAGLNVVVVPFVQQSIPYLHSLQDCYALNVHKLTVRYQRLQDHSYVRRWVYVQ